MSKAQMKKLLNNDIKRRDIIIKSQTETIVLMREQMEEMRARLSETVDLIRGQITNQ